MDGRTVLITPPPPESLKESFWARYGGVYIHY